MSGTLEVVEPATERVLDEVPRAGVDDLDAAVELARAAWPAWRDVAPAAPARAPPALAPPPEGGLQALGGVGGRHAGQTIGGARGGEGAGGRPVRPHPGA